MSFTMLQFKKTKKKWAKRCACSLTPETNEAINIYWHTEAKNDTAAHADDKNKSCPAAEFTEDDADHTSWWLSSVLFNLCQDPTANQRSECHVEKVQHISSGDMIMCDTCNSWFTNRAKRLLLCRRLCEAVTFKEVDMFWPVMTKIICRCPPGISVFHGNPSNNCRPLTKRQTMANHAFPSLEPQH